MRTLRWNGCDVTITRTPTAYVLRVVSPCPRGIMPITFAAGEYPRTRWGIRAMFREIDAATR